MWNWLVCRLKPRHALDRDLGSPRALERFIGALPNNAPDRALAAVIAVFDQVPLLGLEAGDLLRALNALDEFAQPFAADLSARLLDNSPKQLICEHSWNQLKTYFAAIEAGYAHAVGRIRDGADSQEHGQATIATCRILRAMAKRNMLLRMRYRESSPELWRDLEHLWEASGARAQNRALLSLYPGEPADTSIEREYLVALLFEAAPTSNLLPAQVHAVDLLLRRHAGRYVLAEQHDEKLSAFALDPSAAAKPARWLKGLATKPGMRFFGLGEGYRDLLAERESGFRARCTPPWLAATQLSIERYRELLERLAAHWGVTPPARRQRREPAAGEILVAHDFAQIRRLIGFSELARTGRSMEYDRFSAYTINGLVRGRNDAPLQAPHGHQVVSTEDALRNLETFERALDESTTEAWTIADMSEDGLGMECGGNGGWAKAGMLIAYRRPASAHWSMAVVRRINRAGDGKLRIGLRKLHGIPYGARVTMNDSRQTGARASDSNATLSYDVIKLAGETTVLLLPPGVFDSAWGYTLTVGHRWDSIRMERCRECGLDFELIEFTALKAQQAA